MDLERREGGSRRIPERSDGGRTEPPAPGTMGPRVRFVLHRRNETPQPEDVTSPSGELSLLLPPLLRRIRLLPL
ncbi:hypothetical protein DTO207G8_8480 [Paecilomyces variotii]|nr:hypothetical protein DTO207G8_8480 [Paecilomyces variotii]KAJ9383224.1 hypothetical protein DTO063F5_5392 [Paecilomyces variotii]